MFKKNRKLLVAIVRSNKNKNNGNYEGLQFWCGKAQIEKSA